MARVAVSSDHLTALADVDALFEKHSIKEIHEISKKIQAEIEKNKEDVRQMVGERYRDLIEAADTITEMKITIQQITKNISSMENQCSHLQQHDVTASPLVASKNSQRKQKFEQYYALAIQIKLLLDVPEKFWNFVETGNYLSATELFLLARHIHANLQFAVAGGIPVTSWFPIVSRQVIITNQFKGTLITACENKLRNSSISDEELIQCICTLLILGNRNIEETFEDFLTARLKCIENLYSPSKHDISVKDQLCETVTIIINTFRLIYSVFYEHSSRNENQKSLLQETLYRINETEIPLMLVAQMGSPAAKYIPKSVTDFRMPKLNSPIQLSSEYLQEHCSKWIDQIIEFVKKNLPKLLHYITSIRGLSFVYDAVWEVIKENENTQLWTNICEDLLHSPFHIWTAIFRSLFLQQIKTIIQSVLDAAFNTSQQQIFGFLENIAKNDPSSYVERDISNFLWTEFDDFISNNSADKENLMMKSKGFTPFTQRICMLLNGHLTTLLDDLVTFKQDFNLDSENSEVQTYLITAVANNIQEMVANCHQTVLSKRPPESKNLHDPSVSYYITCILVLSRMWRAIIEMCPSLEKCLTFSSAHSSTVASISKSFTKTNDLKIKNENEDSTWLKIKNVFNEECNAMLRLWKEVIVDHYSEKMSNMIRVWTPEEALLFIPQWDSFKIQEETEDGEPVTSTIRIPAHVSCLIYNTLYQLCTEINSVGGHTLSWHILQELQHDLIKGILDAYEAITVQKMSQVTAIQLLFDLQFICTICGIGEEKEFSSQMQTVINNLENEIDPFDLDVFNPHIQANLRRCIQRSCVLFGALINPNRTNLSAYSIRSTSLTSQQEQHGILPINLSSPRFCLLPIGDRASETAKSHPSGVKKVHLDKSDLPVTASSNSGTTSVDSAKLTASYLFEAMSSSWFRN